MIQNEKINSTLIIFSSTNQLQVYRFSIVVICGPEPPEKAFLFLSMQWNEVNLIILHMRLL